MTIINKKNNFIFIHPRRTGGSSMVLSLLKFCATEDIICDDVLHKHADKWIKQDFKYNFRPKFKKKFNTAGFKHLFFSCIKILPIIKNLKKFNYSPNFNLKIPLFVKEPEIYSHTKIDDVRKLSGEYFFKKAFKFTIVRNPYDQFLSFYRASDSKEDFLTFTKKNASYFFNREISHFYKDIKIYNKIVRFESFEEDLADLSRLINLPENVYDIFKEIKVNKSRPKNEKRIKSEIVDGIAKNIIYKQAEKIFRDFRYKK